jgi:hypothetical protein
VYQKDHWAAFVHHPNFQRMILKGEGTGIEKKKWKTIKELIITTVLNQSKLASTLPAPLPPDLLQCHYRNNLTSSA